VNIFDIVLGIIFLIIVWPFAIKAEADLKSLKEFKAWDKANKIKDGYQ